MDTTHPVKFSGLLTFGQALLSPLPEGTQLMFACYAHIPESPDSGTWQLGEGSDATMFYCASRAHVERALPALSAAAEFRWAPRLGRILVLAKDGWALPIEEAMWQEGDEDIAAIRPFPIFGGEDFDKMVAEGKISFAA